MTKSNPMKFKKWSGRKYPGAGKKMLPKPKPKSMSLEEIKRELKQKKQHQRGPRVRGRKAIT